MKRESDDDVVYVVYVVYDKVILIISHARILLLRNVNNGLVGFE